MKRISKVWVAAGVVVVIAIAAWALSGNKKEQHPASDTVLPYSFCHGLQRPVCVPSCIGGTSSSQ